MDSDPDLEIIEKDSGMSSLGGSKDETPERRPVIVCTHLFSFFSSHCCRCYCCDYSSTQLLQSFSDIIKEN